MNDEALPLDRPRRCIFRCRYMQSFKAQRSAPDDSSELPKSTYAWTNLGARIPRQPHIYPSASIPLDDRRQDRFGYVYVYTHILQDSSKFRTFGDPLHGGAIRIPFKQVAARMKLISLRLPRMQWHSRSGIPLFADLTHSSTKCAR